MGQQTRKGHERDKKLKILKDLEEAKWEFIAPDTVDENL